MSSSLTSYLVSPIQAANTFSQTGGLPRQRNVFIVRFISPVISQLQVSNSLAQNLTYVVKTIERPRINPKTEELSQYNKKRHVHTGFKLEPVRMQFYDDASCTAQQMWKTYAGYYFGDLNNQVGTPGQNSTGNSFYSYDMTTNNFNDPGTGFGFTARNGGSSNPNDQFFFDRIEIYHFYDAVFDLYYLIHPRFSAFEPDDLDYENSGIAMLSATVVYENLQYFPQQPLGNTQFPEFEAQFFGNPLILPDVPFPNSNTSSYSGPSQSNPSIASLLSSAVTSAVNSVTNYRYNSDPSTGPIGLFGNFSFGQSTAVASLSPTLSNMTLGNPALATALNIGSTSNPLATNNSIVLNSAAASNGLNGASYDALSANVQGATSGYGTAGQTVTTGLLAASAIGASSVSTTNTGSITLNAQTYGTINAQQTGTAQYGYNVNTDSSGNSWGSGGSNGFSGPNNGSQNNGPFTSNEPAGLDARFVEEQPFDITDSFG